MISRLRLLAIDLGLLCVATVLALMLRENLTIDPQKLADLLPYLAFSLALAVPANLMLGLDRALLQFTDIPDYIRAALAACLTAFGATIMMFLFNRMDGVSRSIPLMQALIAIFLLVGARLLVRNHHARTSVAWDESPLASIESNMRAEAVLLIGVNHLSQMLINRIGALSDGEMRIGGVLAVNDRANGRSLGGHLVFGPHENLPSILRKLELHGIAIRRIMLTIDPEELPFDLRATLHKTAGARGIAIDDVRPILDIVRPLQVAAARGAYKPLSSPLARIRIPDEEIQEIVKRPYWRHKRALDAALAGVLLILLSPVIAGLALLIRIGLGAPVYFWQERTGFDGRPVRLYKFRSMSNITGTDAARRDDNQRQNALGRFMRATRLDELPQLWNVLVGEMSFVGPRPLLPADLIDGATARWLARPGLTGWAQVMGGRDLEAADKMALDLWYIRNASLRLDLEIAMRTIPMILRGDKVNEEAIKRAWRDLHARGTPDVALDMAV